MTPTGIAVTLRQRTPEDEPFLYGLYYELRTTEFSFLPPAQKEQLIRMQYNAQSGAYAANYPDSGWEIIVASGEPVGRIWISRSEEGFELVEITIAESARNRGIGTILLDRLKTEAAQAGKPVRLSVSSMNHGSLRFHQRHGFQIVHMTDAQIYLEWLP